MVSKRNLFVKRMGVSFMATIADGDDVDENDGVVVCCFRAVVVVAVPVPAPDDDDGNKHLLYIVAVGRLNGIILHR
jgi:hypothetical protein